METLFNYFVKHQESTEDFHTLILTMYETVEGNKANWIDKNLTSDELSKIWACCNDLRLIFDNAQLLGLKNIVIDVSIKNSNSKNGGINEKNRLDQKANIKQKNHCQSRKKSII